MSACMYVCMLDLEVVGWSSVLCQHACIVCMLDLEVVVWSSVLCQHACVCVGPRGGWSSVLY